MTIYHDEITPDLKVILYNFTQYHVKTKEVKH